MAKHEYQRLYRTYRWKKIRDAHISANPICEMCLAQGKTVLARVVDHIIPHKGDIDLFYSGPFQSLCYPHHNSTKQKMEKREVIIGGDSAGNPLDKNSHWYK